MAKFSATSLLFLIDGYNFLAPKLKSVGLKISSLTEPSDGVDDNFEAFSPVGKQMATLTQGGAFFETSSKNIHDAMATNLGSTPNATPRVGCLGVMGNTVGAVFWGIAGLISVAYEAALELSKLTKANAEHLLDGLVERGQIVQPLAAKTVDWNTKTLGTVVDFTTDPSQVAIPITSATKANPCVVTTTVPHGLTTGQRVLISGNSLAGPSINADSAVTVLSSTTFSVAINTSASTGAGTGGSFVLANTVNGGGAYQQVTDFTGFTGYVGKIRHSADDTTYADLATFTNVTTSPVAQRVAVAPGTTINRYLCHDGDVTGSGSITVMSGFCRS
jgi:hypothetical protein